MSDVKLKPFKIPQENLRQGKKNVDATVSYFKAHWVDYLLLLFVCFALGAFDVFILKRSDNLFQPSYWYHAACRISAYYLAAVLGIRIGYPKAKNACDDLKKALQKNQRLLVLKGIDGKSFNNFVCRTNTTVKIGAWKTFIENKLKKLNKTVPDFFLLYYNDKKEDYFERFKPKKRANIKRKADAYCHKRVDLETLLTDEYIKKNIDSLNINYYVIKDTDFNSIVENGVGYKYYKTRANVKKNASRAIGSSLVFTVVLTLIIGSVSISFDEALLASRIVAIFSIIINAIVDIGLTLWRFLNGYFDCERIVREEDLRAALDQNELLVLYRREVPEELIKEYEKEVELQQKEEEKLKLELEKA